SRPATPPARRPRQSFFPTCGPLPLAADASPRIGISQIFYTARNSLLSADNIRDSPRSERTAEEEPAAMPVIAQMLHYQNEIAQMLDNQTELAKTRRDIHAHPELAFAEERTADLVAARLAEYGCEVHRGLAGTGVVGTIRRGNTPAAIGLRADMDALRIQEMNEFAYRSTHDGKMHACGHDGPTTMLRGAAKYLAATRNFQGTVHLIFQPAEEGGGGGRVMVEEGLFDKFPCDAVFALHNKPGIEVGTIAARPGPL